MLSDALFFFFFFFLSLSFSYNYKLNNEEDASKRGQTRETSKVSKPHLFASTPTFFFHPSTTLSSLYSWSFHDALERILPR